MSSPLAHRHGVGDQRQDDVSGRDDLCSSPPLNGRLTALSQAPRLVPGYRVRVSAPPRVGFVLEQTLGHVTHADNLVRLVTPDPRIEAEFAPIDFDLDRRWARLPGHGNWTVRAGLRARRAVRALGATADWTHCSCTPRWPRR